MSFYKKDAAAEEKITEMEEIIKSGEFEESYIRELVANQKGELSVTSRYYKGNIAEGNWSLIDDSDIETLDKEIIDTKSAHSKPVDVWDIIFESEKEPSKKEDEYTREKDAEWQYVFIPSYYAVKTLILYYLKDKKDAKKIYGLKNAVVRRDIKKDEVFYGGLPFILRYIEKISKDDPSVTIKFDFAELMEELIDRKRGLEVNKQKDDFINDIIDCIKKSHCKDFILEKRIKDFKDAKEKYIEYRKVDDYKILMHRDVEKDWAHLKKGQIKKVNEKIYKTPKHPNNNFPKDSEPLKGDLKGWFSQEISKKDRLVYKIDKKEKNVYIATVCDHYKDASRRSESTCSYR